jgi:hypothetical protein
VSENSYWRDLSHGLNRETDELRELLTREKIGAEELSKALNAARAQLEDSRQLREEERGKHTRTEVELTEQLLTARFGERRAKAQIGVLVRAVDALLGTMKRDDATNAITLDVKLWLAAWAQLEEVMVMARGVSR